MAFEVFKWIIAAASIAGVVLNIRKKRICFHIWAGTNLAWTAIDVWHEVWAQAALQAVYFGLAIWGILSWRKNERAV